MCYFLKASLSYKNKQKIGIECKIQSGGVENNRHTLLYNYFCKWKIKNKDKVLSKFLVLNMDK